MNNQEQPKHNSIPSNHSRLKSDTPSKHISWTILLNLHRTSLTTYYTRLKLTQAIAVTNKLRGKSISKRLTVQRLVSESRVKITLSEYKGDL